MLTRRVPLSNCQAMKTLQLPGPDPITITLRDINLNAGDGFYVISLIVTIADTKPCISYKSYIELRILEKRLESICRHQGAKSPNLPNVPDALWKRRKTPVFKYIIEKLMLHRLQNFIQAVCKLPENIVNPTHVRDFFLNLDTDPNSDVAINKIVRPNSQTIVIM